MNFPITDMEKVDAKSLDIKLSDEGTFVISVKGYTHNFTEEELLAEMNDQLDVRNSVRGALLRKAQKIVLSGLKKGRLRLSEEDVEIFDLNILIWFADKALKGEHKSYLS